MNWERGLDHQRQQRGDNDRARAKLVNFDMRFAADIKRVVHRLATGGEVPAPAADGCPLAGCSLIFVSRGRRDNRNSTFSTRSRVGAGLMRICFNGCPGLISATVATRKSRREMRSIP